MRLTTTKLDTDMSKLKFKGRINGNRYWMASQVADAMGLPYDDDFKSVINGAMGLCYRDGENANNHFLEIKSLEDGDGDYILSENAVYLIGVEYNDFNIKCDFGDAKYHQFGFVDTERRSRFYINDRVRILANPSDWPNADFVGMEGTIYEFQGDKVRVIVKGRIGTYDPKDIELSADHYNKSINDCQKGKPNSAPQEVKTTQIKAIYPAYSQKEDSIKEFEEASSALPVLFHGTDLRIACMSKEERMVHRCKCEKVINYLWTFYESIYKDFSSYSDRFDEKEFREFVTVLQLVDLWKKGSKQYQHESECLYLTTRLQSAVNYAGRSYAFGELGAMAYVLIKNLDKFDFDGFAPDYETQWAIASVENFAKDTRNDKPVVFAFHDIDIFSLSQDNGMPLELDENEDLDSQLLKFTGEIKLNPEKGLSPDQVKYLMDKDYGNE